MRPSPCLAAFGLLAASGLLARPAAAAPGDEATREPPVALALAAGAATALLPLTIGAMATANAPVYSYGLRNSGYIVAGAGLVLTPIVAHIVVGEHRRAAAFGAAPLAAEIAMIALVSAKPDAVFSGDKLSRSTFGLLFAVDAFGAALGLVDVALAGERAIEKRRLTIVPRVGGGQIGIVVGGIL